MGPLTISVTLRRSVTGGTRQGAPDSRRETPHRSPALPARLPRNRGLGTQVGTWPLAVGRTTAAASRGARPTFEAPLGQFDEHHPARLGRARPAPQSRARRGLSGPDAVLRARDHTSRTPGADAESMIADGCARLTVRLTRSTSLGLSNRPQRPHERLGRRPITPGPRQTTQDSTYPRRKYLRAVSRLTALAREARSVA